MTGELAFFAVSGAVAGLTLLGVSLHLRRRHRLLRDLPTSKASGVFVGLVELAGTAESAVPLRGFLSGRPAVHYAYSVDEHWSHTVTETYTDAKGKIQTRTRHESGWTTVASGGETQPFYVRDDTGAVLLRPEGAKIETLPLFASTVTRGDPLYYGKGPVGAVMHSDHERRFTEWGIPLHAPLYIVGQARERADMVAPEIAASKGAALFLISTRTEAKVSRSYGIGSWICWVLGLIAAAVCGAAMGGGDHSVLPISLAAGIGLYLALWGGCWVWMVYNSLVSLRERVRQGWSLIDVQLARRHDLIPRLAAVVAGLGAHEREVQTALAALRSQEAATPPGVAGPDHDGLARQLRIVLEKYPNLVAQEGFGQMHRELVATEQRIALARSYYNDIATQLATRLEQVPDRWVARLGAIKPQPLLQGEAFERAPVAVNFAA